MLPLIANIKSFLYKMIDLCKETPKNITLTRNYILTLHSRYKKIQKMRISEFKQFIPTKNDLVEFINTMFKILQYILRESNVYVYTVSLLFSIAMVFMCVRIILNTMDSLKKQDFFWLKSILIAILAVSVVKYLEN